MVDSPQYELINQETGYQTKMAQVVVEAIVRRFEILPDDRVEITDVAIAPSVPRISFWCRFEIVRNGAITHTGALLAWFLGEDLPPVLQFFQQSV
ncbi:MAG: hypothetical protein JWO82_4449 [Akkermansiaceae bacterium]|nr:hypothetical protein [Akkermansiaceae bacterium]